MEPVVTERKVGVMSSFYVPIWACNVMAVSMLVMVLAAAVVLTAVALYTIKIGYDHCSENKFWKRD